MTLNEYQQLAARTIRRDLEGDIIEMHALFGISAEAGEILGLFQKELQGHSFSVKNLKKEMGDLLWTLAELASVEGFTLEEVAQLNIEKLKLRYPNGFSAEDSIKRADTREE